MIQSPSKTEQKVIGKLTLLAC